MPRDEIPTLGAEARADYECVALLLQGGGALGAYQAGVYEAMAEAGLEPDWVAGISIGAINSAIIAGNPPADRVDKLKAFWETVTEPVSPWWPSNLPAWFDGDQQRRLLSQGHAWSALQFGAPGFFSPRQLSPFLMPAGAPGATSHYDTGLLKTTLEQLVDFDRIDAGRMRLSVGAVNVRTGNFAYFDSEERRIRPEHIMASGALPPGFPAVEVDGEHYWDGGLVSNTPLDWVVNSAPRRDTLALQVDLWSASGEVPRDLAEVAVRQKEIQYSSRTRSTTDNFRRHQQLRCALDRILEKVSPEQVGEEDYQLLRTAADEKVYSIVQLIYHAENHEGDFKDYEFSRASMEAHWRAGVLDARRTLRHPGALKRPVHGKGVRTFDVTRA